MLFWISICLFLSVESKYYKEADKLYLFVRLYL